MASIPDPSELSLDLQEQIASINRMQVEISRWKVEMVKTAADVTKMAAEMGKIAAETAKVQQETRFAPWTVVLTAMGAASAFFAAGAAFTKLFTH